MKFLKGLAVTIVGFLLFLSLSAWTTVFMLKQTIVNPDFIVSEINKLDAAELGKEMLGEQIKAQLPPELNLSSSAVDEVFDEMGPWFTQEASRIIYAVFDYLGGKTDGVLVDISFKPMKTSLETIAVESLSQSLPPEIAMLPVEQRGQFINEYVRQYLGQIPDNFTFDLNKNNIPPEYQDIVYYLRWGVTNLNMVFWGLIGLMALWALCLFALYRDVKGFSRSLASPMLTVGILGFAGIWVSEHLILPQAGTFGLSLELGRWINQFMVDVGAKLYILYISLAVAGIILLLLSIFWRRKERKDSAQA